MTNRPIVPDVTRGFECYINKIYLKNLLGVNCNKKYNIGLTIERTKPTISNEWLMQQKKGLLL